MRLGDVQCRCFLCGWVFYLKPSGESQPDSHTVLVAACTFRLSDIRVQTNMMIRMMCIDEQGQAGPNIASSMRPTCTLGKRSVRKMLEHTCVAPHCLKSPQTAVNRALSTNAACLRPASVHLSCTTFCTSCIGVTCHVNSKPCARRMIGVSEWKNE